MISSVPIKIMEASRTVTLKHPNSIDCGVYRKVLLRTGENMGGMATLGGLGVLKNEDEPDFEYQRLGMGKILVTSRFAGADMSDRGDAVVTDEPMQEALIVSAQDVPAFEPKKGDLVAMMPGGGVVIGFEIVGTTGIVSIYPYSTKFIISSRDELHDLQPWRPGP